MGMRLWRTVLQRCTEGGECTDACALADVTLSAGNQPGAVLKCTVCRGRPTHALPLLLLLPATAGLAPDLLAAGPEPANWYVGDIHVHRSCGSSPASVSSIYNTEVSS